MTEILLGIVVKGKLRCLGSNQHLKEKFGTGYRLSLSFKEEHTYQVLEFVQRLFPNANILETSLIFIIFHSYPYRHIHTYIHTSIHTTFFGCSLAPSGSFETDNVLFSSDFRFQWKEVVPLMLVQSKNSRQCSIKLNNKRMLSESQITPFLKLLSNKFSSISPNNRNIENRSRLVYFEIK